jgi:hypothetical protein
MDLRRGRRRNLLVNGVPRAAALRDGGAGEGARRYT